MNQGLRRIMRLIAMFAVILTSSLSTHGQEQENLSTLSSPYNSLIENLLARGTEDKLFPGASLSLYTEDTLIFYNAGYANLQTDVKTSNKTRYHLGSVGKLLTAIAVLQQVDEGTLDLHADISNYLDDHDFELYNNEPLTLHCLLTHSCGLNDINVGYMAKSNHDLVPLETYIKDNYPGVFQSPGKDIMYSNYSYALAGLIVEKVSGKKFASYINERLFDPLKMNNSSLDFPEDYQSNDQYAAGYRKVKSNFEEVTVYPRHAVPAGSLVSTSEDMAKLIEALFNRDADILSPSAWQMFFSEQFSNHPILNGYSYGLERQNINGVTAWAKGGALPGTLSNILIIPDTFALFYVANTDNDEFGEFFYRSLFDSLHLNKEQIRQQKPVNTEKYTGVYRNKRYNRNTAENIVSLFRGQLDVYDNATHDTLLIYHNSGWNSYISVDDGLFQDTEKPYEYLYFEEDQDGKIVNLYRNQNISGLSVPASYERTKWYNSPLFINEYYGIVLLVILSGLLLFLGQFLVRTVRRLKAEIPGGSTPLKRYYDILGITTITFIVHTYLGPIKILRASDEFLFGYPGYFRIATILAYLLIPLTIALGFWLWKIWQARKGNLALRVYMTLIQVAIIIHLVYLYYWNFI